MKKEIYHWTYQCHRCFIKSGHGFTGNIADAYSNTPTCCAGEAMYPVRGREGNERRDR